MTDTVRDVQALQEDVMVHRVKSGRQVYSKVNIARLPESRSARRISDMTFKMAVSVKWYDRYADWQSDER